MDNVMICGCFGDTARPATPAEKRLLLRALTAWRGPRLPGGKRHDLGKFDSDQLAIGVKIEMEHTTDPALALEIAAAHLYEDRLYYAKLEKMEHAR
jgi:hypothetical protein